MTIEKGTNEISRTEQKMQGLGKLELMIQNGHSGMVNTIKFAYFLLEKKLSKI